MSTSPIMFWTSWVMNGIGIQIWWNLLIFLYIFRRLVSLSQSIEIDMRIQLYVLLSTMCYINSYFNNPSSALISNLPILKYGEFRIFSDIFNIQNRSSINWTEKIRALIGSFYLFYFHTIFHHQIANKKFCHCRKKMNCFAVAVVVSRVILMSLLFLPFDDEIEEVGH